MPYLSTLAEPSTKNARSMAVWHAAVKKKNKKNFDVNYATKTLYDYKYCMSMCRILGTQNQRIRTKEKN